MDVIVLRSWIKLKLEEVLDSFKYHKNAGDVIPTGSLNLINNREFNPVGYNAPSNIWVNCLVLQQ